VLLVVLTDSSVRNPLLTIAEPVPQAGRQGKAPRAGSACWGAAESTPCAGEMEPLPLKEGYPSTGGEQTMLRGLAPANGEFPAAAC
jgi:hypothetical protein